MSRGRPSRRAFEAAVAIARTRGYVVFLETRPGSVCDFLIITPYGVIAVCVRRTRRIRADAADIARAYHETLNRLRAADHCPGIDCEFWLWSPYGTMRFFRVEGSGFIELGPSGQPLVPEVSGTFAGQPDNRAGRPGEPAGQENFPEKSSGPPAVRNDPAGEPAAPAAGPPGTREPPYVRYLRWRNAEARRKQEGPGAAGPAPDAGPSPGSRGDAGGVSPT